MQPILTVSDLHITLESLEVIKNLSLELNEGESLAIIGPNGSGKTVFLRCLLGLLPYEGTITWRPDVKLGFVPQKIEADRHLPINLANLLTAKARYLKVAKPEIMATVEEVGLTKEVLSTPIGHLSGGQFQKSLIAFALLGKPNVLLLDEPTASIDQRGKELIYALVHHLQQSHRMTVLLVSHEMNIVRHYATMMLCLHGGEASYGRPKEILTKDNLNRLYGDAHTFFHDHRANNS